MIHLLTEHDLERMTERFLDIAGIPWPPYWTDELKRVYVEHFIVPGIYHALLEVKFAVPAYGFDIENVHPIIKNEHKKSII